MIVVVVVFLHSAGPLGALRSQQAFATLDQRNATLQAEMPRYAQASELLSVRLGTPVTFEARCVDLAPGVAA